MDGEPALAPTSNQSATNLAQRIVEGDRSAEEELVSSYRRGVLLIATTRTRDPDAAKDVTQEVFIAVLQALRQGKLREHEKLTAFIHGVTRNLVNNYLGSRVRRSECELTEESSNVDPIEGLEVNERRLMVRRELAELRPTDQQILLLSLVDGHSLAEIARRLNISHEAVRARKSRVVRKITKKFARMSHT